jgi:hypothetical protein
MYYCLRRRVAIAWLPASHLSANILWKTLFITYILSYWKILFLFFSSPYHRGLCHQHNGSVCAFPHDAHFRDVRRCSWIFIMNNPHFVFRSSCKQLRRQPLPQKRTHCHWKKAWCRESEITQKIFSTVAAVISTSLIQYYPSLPFVLCHLDSYK